MDRYKSIRINKGYEKSFEKLQDIAKSKNITVNLLLNNIIEEYTKGGNNLNDYKK